MDEVYNVLSNAVCQRKTQISFHLVNSALFLPLGNLLYESFKVFDLIPEIPVVILLSWKSFGSSCLGVSAIKLGAADNCFKYGFHTPGKIEDGCVGSFPL